MMPLSPRLLADAACYVCKPHQQQRALDEFSGYRRGGPRLANHTTYVQKDSRQLASMLKSNHPYDLHELRRSASEQEADPSKPEHVGDPEPAEHSGSLPG